ncbi:ArnT family glycosyltransferase [Nocardioides pantholopis]|uniref:ArnT family glycosyltransferase n=1 Tax=Nocardioides pantholopis TaxID=2483798 RepID=UPI000FD78F74|nr:glycosyltransferase family 39 protein [Nocardioides pantholopis]
MTATAVPAVSTGRRPTDPAPIDTAPSPAPRSGRRYRLGLVALLAATAVLYLWGLSESGWANSFYSAAAQAGSESWTAFFFGSSDAANSITVDKTPLALWPMALAVRLFGLSSWSILAPQAIAGVLAVWLLTATVRRTTGSPGAALLAGAVLALTPVAALMFRFNNPDALLVLLLVAAAYAVLRAVEAGPDGTVQHPVRWLALAGALVGLAFLAKMLQAFLVLPAFALVYLVAGQPRVLKRLGHLLVAFGSIVLAGGWWVAIVELWPASSRPYIGGSQHNSILELTLGYNGFGRLSGNETGAVGGGGPGGPSWGETGLGRLFAGEIGGQIAWLLPAALILLVAGLWFTRGRGRTDLTRAALLLWGGWLLVTGLTFSLMAGIFHAYYTVALAPAIAALVGIGAALVWQHRHTAEACGVAAVSVAATVVTAFLLLGRSTDFLPWLRWPVLVVGVLAALVLAGLAWLPRRAAAAAALLALITALAGPTAYAVQTAATPHIGSMPTAGPTVAGGGPGGGPAGGPGGPGGALGAPPGQGQFAGPGQGQLPGPAQPPSQGQAPGQGGGPGGLLHGSEPSAELTAMLEEDAEDYTWVAAAVGSNSAAGYQLATEEPVMAIGGFNGSDPSPTLAQFQQYVEDGEIHYFIGGDGFGPSMGGSDASSEIAAWVAERFASTTVDGVTVYDLTSPISDTGGVA